MKLRHDHLLSNCAFKFILRRHTLGDAVAAEEEATRLQRQKQLHDPAAAAAAAAALGGADDFAGRSLHSSTFRLILSALYGIGDARRVRVARIERVFRGSYGVYTRRQVGCVGVFLCQTRLKLS